MSDNLANQVIADLLERVKRLESEVSALKNGRWAPIWAGPALDKPHQEPMHTPEPAPTNGKKKYCLHKRPFITTEDGKVGICTACQKRVKLTSEKPARWSDYSGL